MQVVRTMFSSKKSLVMKGKNNQRIVILILIGIIFNSCEKEDDFAQKIKEEGVSKVNPSEGARKLDNPYTVKNMKRAFENIKSKMGEKQIISKNPNIQNYLKVGTSHYYIKFKPKTEDQEGIIKSDSTMYLSDYPLDWEFTDEYLNSRPELPEGTFPEYYVAVPVDKTLPKNVPYEILEELYIPEEDPMFNNGADNSGKTYTKKGTINNNEDLLRHLLNEAYTLTGNEDDLLDDPKNNENLEAIWIFGSKWYPSGTLKIWDDNAGKTTSTKSVFSHWEYYDCDDKENTHMLKLMPMSEDQCKKAVYKNVPTETQGKYVPLAGAQVLMRQWFTVRQGITDQNGYFSTGFVRGKARYIIQWERYHYSIRNGSLFQAETRGPRVKKQAWNHNIKGGDDEYHGMIHTAAHIYYYGSRFGLTSPPTNATFKKQMKIAAREQNGTSSHVHQRRWIHLAQIHIKEWGEESQQVFGTTIHELAHAAHWNLDKNAYNNLVWDGYISDEVFNNAHPGDVRTLETWATTVEIMFALKRYRDFFNQPSYEYGKRGGVPIRNFQLQRKADENFYTSAGFDMIDNINQRNLYGSAYPIDRVSGYTIKQLENGLRGTKSWKQWRDNIKNKYSNPTEQYLDELFNNWN